MIVTDTDVWSEAVRRVPDAAVMSWMLAHRAELALTSVTIGELRYGLEIMPRGRRRDALTVAVERLIDDAAHRTYAYDSAAARELARIRAERRRAGRDLGKPEDAMIAGIAAANRCAVATRNVTDFEGMGVEIVNPWGYRA